MVLPLPERGAAMTSPRTKGSHPGRLRRAGLLYAPEIELKLIDEPAVIDLNCGVTAEPCVSQASNAANDMHPRLARLNTVAVFLALPCLAPFLNDEPDNGQRCHCVHPGCAEQEVGGQADRHNER